MEKKTNRWGWAFLIVASAMIMIFSFYPMFSALIMSFKTGSSANMKWATPWYNNYLRMFKDKTFIMALKNTFLYLIIQVPVMLVLAILLAQLLNNPNLKCRGLFRTCIFLPCAISLVSYSLIFRTLFYDTGMMTGTARAVIITALIWRWTGYNMVFYLAGLQNLDYQVYEAAQIDGANGWKTFWHITVPQLRPVIIMTFIMSINGTLQLYDESVNLTNGGPAGTTMTMSHHIYNTAFQGKANFGYAAALSFVVFILVAILAAINLKVGDTRD